MLKAFAVSRHPCICFTYEHFRSFIPMATAENTCFPSFPLQIHEASSACRIFTFTWISYFCAGLCIEAWGVWSEPDAIIIILTSSFLKWSYFLRNWLSSEDSSRNESVKLALKLLNLRSLSCFVSGHVINRAPHLRKEARTLILLLTWCFWLGFLFCLFSEIWRKLW